MEERLAKIHDFLNSISVDSWSSSTEGSRVHLKSDVIVSGYNRHQLISFLEAFRLDLSELRISESSQIPLQDSLFSDLTDGTPVKFIVKFKVGSWIFRNIGDAKNYYASAHSKSSAWLTLEPLELVNTKSKNSPEWESFLSSYNIAAKILRDLTELSHHKSGDEAIYVDSSESLGPSLVLSSNMSAVYGHDSSILEGLTQATFLSRLSESVSAKHGDYLKEWAVLRASLIEFFKGTPERKCPLRSSAYLLKNLTEFQDIFLKNLQTYVSGLSLEKLRTELANEQLKLSEKASSGLMDISGKMLMLPVVLGVGRFLPGIDVIHGFFLIMLTCIILLLSLITQRKQLNNIKSSNQIAFEDLDNKLLHDGNESIRLELGNIRENLDETTTVVEYSICAYIAICALTLMYFFYKIVNAFKVPPDAVDHLTSYFNLLNFILFI